MPRRFWKQLTGMKSGAPLVFWSLVVLLIAESAVVALGPLMVPDHIYLQGYLSSQAEASLAEFYAGDSSALVFDETCGWRNRPGFARDKWVLDRHGARTTGAISAEPTDKRRILFLGSSLINGGTDIENTETISAAVEDPETESLNMGTMLYSLDQTLLLYTGSLRKFGAETVVVGLSGRPTEGLTSRFIPLYRRTEAHMPYFKPRFLWQDDGLELVPVPDRQRCATVLESDAELQDLRGSDGYFATFAGFQRCGFTPIARSLWHLSGRLANLERLLREEDPGLDLLIALMHKLEDQVRQDGAQVIFLLLPDREITSPGWRAYLPDQYGRMVDRLQEEEFTVLDGRRVLAESGVAPGRLYQPDQLHYTPRANRIIATALKPLL